jgi:signal peptidase I
MLRLNRMSETIDEKTPVVVRPVADPVVARKELVRALVICFISVILVRSFVFELFKIPSSSMVPTLRIGDHIVVSKFNYGLTFPFTAWEFVNWSAPKRGDVIVFIYPKDESLYYIKRVIGLPGDKIEFKGKDLSVNGHVIPKQLVSDETEIKTVLGAEDPGAGQLYTETIDGVSHYVKYSNSSAFDYSKNPESYQVAADQFFVMGDNRDDSYDSRSWGNVPRHNIRGKAQVIWVSLDRNAGWSSSDKVRWNRSMQVIH